MLGRKPEPERYDAPGTVLKGGGYVILDTRTDHTDPAKARSNAEDALALHPDLGCMVGLFADNVPACIEALATAGKLDQVVVVGFDENEVTLQGILDGHVYGTVVQSPYRYGFESVRILAGLARGDESVLPDGGVLRVPRRVIRRDNVEGFWLNMKKQLGQAAGK